MNAPRHEPATKEDVDLVRKDVDLVRKDVALVKEDVAMVRKDVDQMDQRLSAKIDANSAKIDANGVKIDKLTAYAVENRELVGKMLTEEKFEVHFSQIMSSIDELTKIVSRGEQERIATTAWIKRVEGDVETNTGQIKRIKTKLAMDT